MKPLLKSLPIVLALTSGCASYDVLFVNAGSAKLKDCEVKLGELGIPGTIPIGDVDAGKTVRTGSLSFPSSVLTIAWTDPQGVRRFCTASTPPEMFDDDLYEDEELILIVLPNGNCAAAHSEGLSKRR